MEWIDLVSISVTCLSASVMEMTNLSSHRNPGINRYVATYIDSYFYLHTVFMINTTYQIQATTYIQSTHCK